jgi:hypothetical protein
MKAEMRQKLAELPYEEKIRKVGELISFRQKIKSDVSEREDDCANGRSRVDNHQERNPLLPSPDNSRDPEPA